MGVSEGARVVSGQNGMERTVSRWCVWRARVFGQIGDGILFEETDLCEEAMSRTISCIDQRCNGQPAIFSSSCVSVEFQVKAWMKVRCSARLGPPRRIHVAGVHGPETHQNISCAGMAFTFSN